MDPVFFSKNVIPMQGLLKLKEMPVIFQYFHCKELGCGDFNTKPRGEGGVQEIQVSAGVANPIVARLSSFSFSLFPTLRTIVY